MLFSGKGDNGTTTHLASTSRISKTDPTIEALGALDELGAIIGVCKAQSEGETIDILENLQQDLFVAQAELAGSTKKMEAEKTEWLERKTNEIERTLPPIKTFFIAGATLLSAQLDHARTVSRRAERRIVALHEATPKRPELLSYMNRLSSLLYALARREGQKSGITEKPPTYL